MGLWNWMARVVGLPAPRARTTFSSESVGPIDSLFVDLQSRSRVSRDEALSVPYVQRGRNLLCSIATLPLDQLAPDNTEVPNPLLGQIDSDIANVVTLAQTVEDLIFESVSWWQVTARQADGYPMSARHLDTHTVSLEPPAGRSPAPLPSGLDPRVGVVYVDGMPVPWRDIIRFDSPNPPLLRHGARAIRKALRLDQAAEVYATDPQPLDYFSPRDGMEPESDEALDEFLSDWSGARRKRSTAYVPWQYQYNSVATPSPAELQLVELQKQAGLEIANLLGVDPEDLGISTTSRTYANDVDRRRNRVNDVYAPYMRAITDRLSMGDVTRRGYVVVFKLDDYLKSNPTERWGVYEKAKNMGAMSVPEIRSEEKLPPIDPAALAPAPAEPAPLRAVPDTATAARPASYRFTTPPYLTFIDAPAADFAVNAERRVIEGLIVPYGQSANGYRFERGSIGWADVSRVKLLMGHDPNQAVGVATELADTNRGIRGRFRVARGPEGDRVLQLAEDGVLDGLSVGVDFVLEHDTVPDPKFRDGRLVQRSTLMETSLTPMPAYDNARVTRVAASRYGGTTMPCVTCGQEHAPNVACQTVQPQQQQQASGAVFGAPPQHTQQGQSANQPGAPAVTPPTTVGAPAPPVQQTRPNLTDTWTAEQWDAATRADPLHGMGVTHALMGYNTPAAQQVIAAAASIFQAGPTVVNPTTKTIQVREPQPYRFDRSGNLARGTHEFSSDVFAASRGDQAATERVQKFVAAQFNIATTDVDELNPTTNRPDMYVDQRSFQYPIWEAVQKGTLDSVTPFTFPKFNSASGLVANHTQGTEPTGGSFTTTNATVTPTPVSGKVTINRETFDQGGNPQVSGLLWNQMQKAWYEALEAFAVGVLDAATPTGITLTTAAADDALVDELVNALALLNFVRGGFSMDAAFTQVDLYKKLVAAEDSTGRPLLPPLGPQNTIGTARGRWSGLDVNGVAFLPAWALAASGTVAASSYLFDRASVWAWASVPQRLDFQFAVATIDMGLWGYKAGIITDLAGVREIIYDPA